MNKKNGKKENLMWKLLFLIGKTTIFYKKLYYDA
jgi:hypothetical protein